MNPYDRQRHQPRIRVDRPEVEPLAEKLSRGRSAVLLAGRGMGKSVFLRQVRDALERRGGDLRIVLMTARARRHGRPRTLYASRAHVDGLDVVVDHYLLRIPR